MEELKIGDSVNFNYHGYLCNGILLALFTYSKGVEHGVIEHFTGGDESVILLVEKSKIVKVSHGLNFDMMGG